MPCNLLLCISRDQATHQDGSGLDWIFISKSFAVSMGSVVAPSRLFAVRSWDPISSSVWPAVFPSVRGLYIATGHYSSFGGCALGLMLGVLDIMGAEVRNRGRSERERRGMRDRGRRQNKGTTNTQTCDDMWMNTFYADTSCDTLSRNVMCAQG